MSLTLSECAHRDEYLSDATTNSSSTRSTTRGIIYRLKRVDPIDIAVELIRQSHELAAK